MRFKMLALFLLSWYSDVCEVATVIFRREDAKMRIHQRLVNAKFCKKALEVANIALEVASTTWSYAGCRSFRQAIRTTNSERP